MKKYSKSHPEKHKAYYKKNREVLKKKVNDRYHKKQDEEYNLEGFPSRPFRQFWFRQERMLNFTKSQLGKTGHMKGKHISQARKDHLRLMNLGKKPSLATRIKNSIGVKQYYINHPEARDRVRKQRLGQVFPNKDSKLEVALQTALRIENIPFETHVKIIGQPDIFIAPDICIFVDGCFFHGCPIHESNLRSKLQLKNVLRDMRIHHELSGLGYIVIRIWEHELFDLNGNIASNIMNMIKKHYFGGLKNE